MASASIASAWFFKVLIEVLITPITYAVVAKLKAVEHVDTFDRKTNFNPFAFRACVLRRLPVHCGTNFIVKYYRP